MTLDLTNPNPKTLSWIDSHAQNHSKYYDRKLSSCYPTGSEGWEDVFENNKPLFYQAWGIALEYVQANQLTEEQLTNF